MPAKEQRRKIPKFATEAEEAAWWYKNRAMVSRDMWAAVADGTVRYGGPKAIIAEQKTRPQKNITIRMPEADLELAKHQAGKKGLAYQTYMKMLLHEALIREESRGTRS